MCGLQLKQTIIREFHSSPFDHSYSKLISKIYKNHQKSPTPLLFFKFGPMDADRILNVENVSPAKPLNSLLYFPASNSSFKLPLIVSCVKKLWQAVQVVVLASTCHFFKLKIAWKMRRGNVTTRLRRTLDCNCITLQISKIPEIRENIQTVAAPLYPMPIVEHFGKISQ